MSQLLLHIGPHKTGSTAFQKFFLDRADRLETRGVHYPKLGLLNHYGQHELVVKIRTLDEANLTQYLRDYIQGPVTLISSENFDGLKPDDLRKFRAALTPLLGDPPSIRIVYYVRNYADLLPSAWQEEVKHGSVMAFPEFMLEHTIRPFASPWINPALVLDRYAGIFGIDRIHLIDYDTARDHLILPILPLLGITLEPTAAHTERINTSLNRELVEVIRVLNNIAQHRNEWDHDRTRNQLLRRMSDPPIAEELSTLTAHIRTHLHPFRIAGGFFEKSVATAFRAKYRNCYLNEPSDVPPDRDLKYARDAWLLTGTATCERIYERIKDA
jgi:hypothetical protein